MTVKYILIAIWLQLIVATVLLLDISSKLGRN